MKISMQEFLNWRRHGDPHYVPRPDGAALLVNPVRRFMKAKGIHGKGKKRFRRALAAKRAQDASAKSASPNNLLEGLINASAYRGHTRQ